MLCATRNNQYDQDVSDIFLTSRFKPDIYPYSEMSLSMAPKKLWGGCQNFGTGEGAEGGRRSQRHELLVVL